MTDPKDILDALALAERLAGKSISISPRHGRTMLRKTMAEYARATGARVADSSTPPEAFERPLGPPVACAIDIQPSPLHTPPEGYEWSTTYLGGVPTKCERCGEEYVRGGKIGLHDFAAPEDHGCSAVARSR